MNPLRWAFTTLLGCTFASCVWMNPTQAKAREAGELLKVGRTGEAVALYTEAISERNDDPVLKYDLGLAQYQREDYDSAADALQWALPRAEGELRLLVLQALGNTRFRQGDFVKAIEAYVEALRLHPENRDLKWNLELARRSLRDRSGGERQRLAREMRDQKANAGRNTESGGRAPSVGADPWDLRHNPRSGGAIGDEAGSGAAANAGIGGGQSQANAWLEGVEETLRKNAGEGSPRPTLPPRGGDPTW